MTLLTRRLENKVIIITGAARGMGASHARLLAKHGAKVVLTDVVDTEGAAIARELGSNGLYVHHDVSDGAMWKEVVASTVEKFGRIDVLVNNAGIYPAPEDFFDEEIFNRVIAINLTGTFLGIKHVTPIMKQQGGGSIINISSTAGLVGGSGPVAYTASKFGVTGLTRSLAIALGPDGIRVNNVHPGPIMVIAPEDISAEMAQRAEALIETIPLRRVGTPKDVSHLVVYLASDESSFSTGASFVADGGTIA